MGELNPEIMNDVRLINRNVRNLSLGPKELGGMMAKVKDASDNGQWMNAEGNPCSSEEEEALFTELTKPSSTLYFKEEDK